MGDEKVQPKYKQVDKQLVLKHYDREEILQAMLDASTHKEVVGSFGGVGYGKRPDIVQYKDDILSQVKNGATSFHASEELWEDPLMIHTGMKRDELSAMRSGWDLLLDIDCPVLKYSIIISDIIVKELKRFGISSVSVKFSGNHGFHIAVPFEAFPAIRSNGDETRLLFPEAPRNIAEYIAQNVKSQLSDALLAAQEVPDDTPHFMKLEKSVSLLAESVGLSFDDVLVADGEGRILDPFKVVAIDSQAITSRHLYRQVYSVNEKSGKVSLPINPDKILSFNPEVANLDNFVVSRFTFLDRSIVKQGEGAQLLNEAYSFAKFRDRLVEEQREKRLSSMKKFVVGEKIPKECFPPQIKTMLGPIKDGKKRALFILTQFLRCVGWDNAEVEKEVRAWNNSQDEPLRESYMQGQLHHFHKTEDAIPPQNFDNSVYKEILGEVDFSSDTLLKKVKNPVSYAKIRFESHKEMVELEEKERKKEEREKVKAEKEERKRKKLEEKKKKEEE